MPRDIIIRRPAVLDRTGLSYTTIWRLEGAGKFPARVRLTDSGRVGWFAAEIDEWIPRARPGRWPASAAGQSGRIMTPLGRGGGPPERKRPAALAGADRGKNPKAENLSHSPARRPAQARLRPARLSARLLQAGRDFLAPRRPR